MAGGACVAKGETVVGGMCGGGACVVGGVWQERRPLQRAVRILLECSLVIFYNFWKELACFVRYQTDHRLRHHLPE